MLKERDRDVINWIDEYKLITIGQCGAIFFNKSYEGARRRLVQLEKDYGKIKSYRLKETNEKVYYINKKSTYHNVLVLDYIKTIVQTGGKIIELQLQPRYMDGKIIPDAFFVFEYGGRVYFTLLEVDLYHNTPYEKMKRYEELYKTNEIQNKYYGQFPIIIIAKDTNGTRYNSSNFSVIYTDLHYTNTCSLLL